MSYATLVDGDLVAVEFAWNSESTLTILDLGAASPSLPWTEPCDCGGRGLICDGEFGHNGPCASCWGSGRVLFAFEVDGIAAEYVPPAVAQPWIHQHRTAVHR